MNIENIACTQMRYQEFPDLLFGTSTKGLVYCNATDFIQKKGEAEKHTVTDFNTKFAFWIDAVCETYGLKSDNVVIMNEKGQYLIEESLALILITYIDSAFGVYMLERITEMLVSGVALSDTNLMLMVKDRLSEEQITKLFAHDEKSF